MDLRTSSLSGRKSPMMSGLPDGPDEIIQSGYLNRKCVQEAGGRKSSDRKWTTLWCTIRASTLEFSRVDNMTPKPGGAPPPKEMFPPPTDKQTSAGSVSLELAVVGLDYTSQLNKDLQKRRSHLFQLLLASDAEYIFQASSDKNRNAWVLAIKQVSQLVPEDDTDPSQVAGLLHTIKTSRDSIKHKSRQNVHSIKKQQTTVPVHIHTKMGSIDEAELLEVSVAQSLLSGDPHLRLLKKRLQAKKELLKQLKTMYTSFMGGTGSLYADVLIHQDGPSPEHHPSVLHRKVSLPSNENSVEVKGVAEDKRSSTGNYCVLVREEVPLSPGVLAMDRVLDTELLVDYYLVPGAKWSRLRKGESVRVLGQASNGWYQCISLKQHKSNVTIDTLESMGYTGFESSAELTSVAAGSFDESFESSTVSSGHMTSSTISTGHMTKSESLELPLASAGIIHRDCSASLSDLDKPLSPSDQAPSVRPLSPYHRRESYKQATQVGMKKRYPVSRSESYLEANKEDEFVAELSSKKSLFPSRKKAATVARSTSSVVPSRHSNVRLRQADKAKRRSDSMFVKDGGSTGPPIRMIALLEKEKTNGTYSAPLIGCIAPSALKCFASGSGSNSDLADPTDDLRPPSSLSINSIPDQDSRDQTPFSVESEPLDSISDTDPHKQLLLQSLEPESEEINSIPERPVSLESDTIQKSDSTEVLSELDIRLSFPEEIPQPTELLGESPEPSDLPGESPEPSDLLGESPEPSDLPGESPEPSDLPEESPEPSDLPEESPEPSDLPGESPEQSNLPGESPEPTDEREKSQKQKDYVLIKYHIEPTRSVSPRNVEMNRGDRAKSLPPPTINHTPLPSPLRSVTSDKAEEREASKTRPEKTAKRSIMQKIFRKKSKTPSTPDEGTSSKRKSHSKPKLPQVQAVQDDLDDDFFQNRETRARLSSVSGRLVRKEGVGLVIGESSSESEDEEETESVVEDGALSDQTDPPNKENTKEGLSRKMSDSTAVRPTNISGMKRSASDHDSLALKASIQGSEVSAESAAITPKSTQSLKRGLMAKMSFRKNRITSDEAESPIRSRGSKKSTKSRKGAEAYKLSDTGILSPEANTKCDMIFRAPPRGDKRYVYLDPSDGSSGKLGFRLQSYGRIREQGRVLQTFVLSVVPGSVSFLAGLYPGDAIIEVNGVSVKYAPVEDVVTAIQEAAAEMKRIALKVEFVDGVTRLDGMRRSDDIKAKIKDRQSQLKALIEKSQALSPPDPPSPLAITPAHSLTSWSETPPNSEPKPHPFKYDRHLNNIVALHRDSVGSLECGVLVLPLSSCHQPGSGTENAMLHLLRTGGDKLLDELSLAKQCRLGENIITGGHQLHYHSLYHCVFGNLEESLQKCCYQALNTASSQGHKSITFWLDGFASISVPPKIIIESVRQWLGGNNSVLFERVIFAAKANLNIIEGCMQETFPLQPFINRDSILSDQGSSLNLEPGTENNETESRNQNSESENFGTESQSEKTDEHTEVEDEKSERKDDLSDLPKIELTSKAMDKTSVSDIGIQFQQESAESESNSQESEQNIPEILKCFSAEESSRPQTITIGGSPNYLSRSVPTRGLVVVIDSPGGSPTGYGSSPDRLGTSPKAEGVSPNTARKISLVLNPERLESDV